MMKSYKHKRNLIYTDLFDWYYSDYTKPPEVNHTWPTYLMQCRVFLVHLVFANEKACSVASIPLFHSLQTFI